VQAFGCTFVSGALDITAVQLRFFPLCFVIAKNRWAAEDVDPALYSRELMAHASDAAASEEVSFHLTILVATVLVDE
jgi:hypothetical protein